MPIVLRHQAAGIAPDQDNPRTKYGMAMVLQQQRSDQEMRQRTQDQQYDMQRMGAMGANQAMREPSIGEDDAMLEQEIRSGLYDPDTVRALRQDQRAMRQIMRDTNIDGTQRAQALGNLQSRMRMSRSTGKVQPMMQQMGPAALQTKPPMTEADYFSDEKNYASAYAAAQAKLEASGSNTVNEDNIQAQMHNDYLAKQKFLEGLRQPQGQGQPSAQPPNAPAAAPAANPQASYSPGQPMFGANPVMAQGGFQQSGGQQYDQSMVPAVVDAMRPPVAAPPLGIALAPGHPDYKAPPTPTDRRDERGYVIMSDGSKVDPRDEVAMSTGGRGQQSVMRLTHPDGSQIERRPDSMMNAEYLASNAAVGQGAYQPTGSYTSPEVFGAPNVLANTAQPSQQQPAPMQTPATPAQQQPEKKGKRGYISIAPGGGQSAGQSAGQASGGWKSKSTGVYSPDGKFLGDPSLYDEAGANYIRQQAAPTAAAKPPVATNGRDAAFNAALGSNLDTAYDLANMDRSPGTNYFNPENPEYARMRGADPNIINPPKNVGKFKGRFGLGGVDYGINPATGNRVTMSVRPGGGLEYDEPTGGPRRGGVTVMGGKNKSAPAAATQRVGVEVSPGEGVGPKYAALPVSTPANSSDAAAYQYQSPLAQAASAAMSSPQPSAPAAPASKYGRSASASALGREVDAAMQAGEELEANEQQRAVDIATSPAPEPMSDAERKKLGLPTLKEMEEMRKSLGRNKTMGGIGLGGTGRAAGSYEPIKADKLPKGKGTSAAAQQKKASPQQTGMSQSLTDFASKQRPDVQNAIKEAYDPKLSERARENAIRFLLTQGIDLSEIL